MSARGRGRNGQNRPIPMGAVPIVGQQQDSQVTLIPCPARAKDEPHVVIAEVDGKPRIQACSMCRGYGSILVKPAELQFVQFGDGK